jgi:ketosteroid isomerase-like protein
MSQENVELALAFTTSYNERDIDGAVEYCAVNVTVTPDASVYPESSPLVGRDQFRSLLEDSRSAWASCAHTPKEVLDIGDGRVIIRGDWGGKGIASGVEVYQDLSAIFTVRDGQISKVEYFFGHDRALEAAGVSEQDAHADS